MKIVAINASPQTGWNTSTLVQEAAKGAQAQGAEVQLFDLYPCKHYDGFDSYDTLVLHRNQRKDMLRAKEIGIDAYRAEQQKKVVLLNRLLDSYDDGSRQMFYCAAVNLLSVDDMQAILDKADRETADMPNSERAEYMERELRAFAIDG